MTLSYAATGADNPAVLTNDPDTHGFVIMGKNTIFLNHFAMFNMKDHQYQMILRASLPDYVMSIYLEDKVLHPTTEYVLGNVQFDKMTLPQIKTGQLTAFTADLWRGMPENPNCTPPLIHNIKVSIDDVVYFRHFDESFQPPEHLTYIVYGAGTEVHMTHYISRIPDFQHVLDVNGLPGWIPPLQLNSAFHVTFPGLPNKPTDADVYSKSPLEEGHSYEVYYQGQSATTYKLTAGHSYWFDNENINSSEAHEACKGYDTCQQSVAAHAAH